MKLKHIILHIVNVVQAMSGKNRFLLGFVVVVCVLALVRLISPGVAEPRTSVADLSVADSLATDSVDQLAMAEEDKEEENKAANEIAETSDDLTQEAAGTGSETDAAADSSNTPSIFFDKNGKEVKHRIFSVPHFGNTFPDQQDVQILAANKHGVNPVQNREEAEHSKGKLVYVGSNPFFYVDKLNSSIPYLVPRASVLLQDIGRAYFDSLQIKGIPLHKIIVTSILRTKDDVAKLRTRNGNATENSCHLYGTTFDVCYNRYKQIQTRQQPRRQVQNDTLKWVLSEVLRDMRDRNRCLVKYEVKQGCFHITVK
ncbi:MULTISPECIES: DUF5715 family protein [unclassified Prevotella]|jgi:uncharacterized protein YcbK (DUF882 family)|uniref:DUF5715 family protein n=1 Tax=unclassified Prevotella TaxID=2638335 RepID=UPI003F9A229C